MASAVVETAPTVVPIVEDKITLTGLAREPIKSSGSLDAFESFDVTPVIGREFPNANLKDFLRAPNSDDLLRDLALTSELYARGCVEDRADIISQSPNEEWSSSVSKMV